MSWDEFGIAAEVHGLPHIRVNRWSEDILRANEVIIAGPRLVAFTSNVIRHQKLVVAEHSVQGGAPTSVPRAVQLSGLA